MQSEMRKSLNLILKQFSELDYVHPEDIPNIDLYVDDLLSQEFSVDQGYPDPLGADHRQILWHGVRTVFL